MGENILITKSINQLLEYSYFIPSYQRGYRWTSVEVKQLLEDIWAFAKNPPVHEPGKEKPFYCLQPVVVKQHGTDSKEMEVIDGQQRLTTIFLILKTLKAQIERDQKNFKRISYETRTGSEEFLRNFDANNNETWLESEKNVDYSHIVKAGKTIDSWFKDKANNSDDPSPRAAIAPVFLSATRVIWYEVNENDVNPIDIFTRINIGKIPLTNSELVKALFLHRDNFQQSNATLRQLQIASEWDAIERTLQDDSFWFFLYNPANPLKYDNRIEYIFDLMKGKKKDDEYYYTLNEFQADFSASMKDTAKPDIDKLWMNVKKYFLRFDEWYKDRRFYHLVGFLIYCEYPISTLFKNSEGRTKIEFTSWLEKEISVRVECDLDRLDYKNTWVLRKVLLLFNIETILASKKADLRFPFDRYKDDNWDIEHVRSQNDKKILPNKRKDWAVDILEYFTGIKGYSGLVLNGGLTEKETQKQAIDNIENEKERGFCKSLCGLLDQEKVDDDVFDTLYDEILKHFQEEAVPEDINNIYNLALLDAATNRSYKNAPFPIKRNRIIENDMNGIFVPICTKNVFMKFYSRKMGNVMYWKDTDAEDYLNAIKKTLSKYFPS